MPGSLDSHESISQTGNQQACFCIVLPCTEHVEIYTNTNHTMCNISCNSLHLSNNDVIDEHYDDFLSRIITIIINVNKQ